MKVNEIWMNASYLSPSSIFLISSFKFWINLLATLSPVVPPSRLLEEPNMQVKR